MSQHPAETPAMDTLSAEADEYVGEPQPDDEHDLDADAFPNRDPEDVAMDTEETRG